jgi:hypothetical protein
MAATAPPLAEFDEVVAEKQIDFAVKRHRGGEITEESAQARHCSNSSCLILQLCHEYS